jgi:hypothetical protein
MLPKLIVSTLFLTALFVSVCAPHRARSQSRLDDTLDQVITLPEIVIEPVHKGIVENLILSPRFTNVDVEIIHRAANQWQTATNGIASFVFIDLAHFTPIDDGIKNDIVHKSITVRPADADEDIVSIIDKVYNGNAVLIGYYDGLNLQHTTFPDLFVVMDRLDSPDTERASFVHELGHSIGLGHIDNAPSVMTPMIPDASEVITEQDLQQFCAHYSNCNPEFLSPGTTENNAPSCVMSDFTQL